MNDRPKPVAGVSILVLRGPDVLLVQRANPPWPDVWSLPGGRVELGEPVRRATLRELKEETGVSAELLRLLDVIDIIHREPDGRISAHYILSVFGGRYNSVERFPVFHLTAITMRRDPIYLSTFTGRPPDEPSVMAVALNEVFLPLLRQQFPEIVDFWLPPEGCSYRIGVAAIRKRYPGHARRVMVGLWSFLRQFSYTKLLIIVDEDVDPRSWETVMWALSTRFDASRDVVILENTPIDYLDFASPREGLGGKLGLDATSKIGTETDREWGRVLDMDPDVERRVDELWPKLFNEQS